MKYLLLNFFCLTAFLYGQQTITIPVILTTGDQTPGSLKAEDLNVEVKGQTVSVMSVKPLADEHLQYVLLNDRRKKTRWPNGMNRQTEVARQFLKQVIASRSDTGSLVNFGDKVYIDVQNSTDPDEIAAKLESTGGSETRMYEAVVSSARWLATQAAGTDQRKVMFLLSDGEDKGSESNLKGATEALQRFRIPIFIIAPSSVKSKKEGAILRQLASESGGRAYFLQPETRPTNFDFLNRELRQSFCLTLDIASSVQGELPLTINDIANPGISISAPAQIVLP